MIEVPVVVRNKALAAGAASWLDGLPALVATVAAEWSLTVGRVYPDATEALVAAVVQADGTPAVLKLVVPRAHAVERWETTALRLADGRGCATLLRADEARGAMLLERLGRSLHELRLPIGRRLEILTEAARQVWRPAAGHGLPTGDEKAAWLADFLVATWEALDRPCSERVVEHALSCAERRRRAHDDERAVLVHGDVHEWNALEAAGGGFKLVDPDGLLAEAEYDLGVLMREDPVELRAGDPRERARWLAHRTDRDAEAIWEWGVVERVSTGLLATQVGIQPAGSEMLRTAEVVAADEVRRAAAGWRSAGVGRWPASAGAGAGRGASAERRRPQVGPQRSWHHGPMGDREQLRLDDGRVLDVRVTGPEGGMPLVFHHGTPGALTPVRRVERAVHARGLRLVATSRPGYGDSSRRAGREVVDVVADTEAVLAAVGCDRCLVAGWSGGGPHALACAARLEAAAAVLVIAGVAPADAEGLDWMAGMGEENVTEFGAALAGEATLRAYLGPVREHVVDVTVEGIVAAFTTLLPDVDRAVLTDEFGEDMCRGFREGLRVSAAGWLDDDLAFTGPWGFELGEIATPTAIWQGREDLMVPFSHGRWLAAHVPGAVAHLEDGEGHLSIGLGAIDRMLDELVDLAGGAGG